MSSKIDNKVLELLHRADWEDIIPRLMKYVLSKLSIRTGSPLEGISINEIAHDIVNESIRKVVEGTRKWDPARGPLLKFLKFSVIRSEIDHLYKSDYYDLTQRIHVSPDDAESEPAKIADLSDSSNKLDKQNSNISSASEQIINEIETRDSILKAVEGDDELTDIALCMLDGAYKPEEIANQLNVDTKVIYNAKKRLQRIYKDNIPKKK